MLLFCIACQITTMQRLIKHHAIQKMQMFLKLEFILHYLACRKNVIVTHRKKNIVIKEIYGYFHVFHYFYILDVFTQTFEYNKLIFLSVYLIHDFSAKVVSQKFWLLFSKTQ